MKKKIIFICDPGIGILDNSLSFLNKMNKAEYEIELLLLKNNFIRNFNSKDFITKTSDKIFSKLYFYINNNLYVSENLSKAIQVTDNFDFLKNISLYINKLIFLIFKKRLLFLEKFFYYISFLLKNKLNKNFVNKIDSENVIFDNVKFIIYDVHSEKSKVIKKIKGQIKNIKKLSIFHGSDFPSLEQKHKNKDISYINKCDQIIFSNTELEEYHYEYYFKFDNQLLKFGCPKHSSDWIKFVLDNAEKENFLKEKFVFLMTRHHDEKWFPLKNKINYLKDIKKIIIDELNYKLVLRLHPKESEELNNNLLNEIFGKKNYGKTWQISNLSPYLIGKHSQFALSFFTGLAVDLWFVGCPTIEYLSFNDVDMSKIKSDDPKFYEQEIYYKNNEYIRKIRFNDLVIGSSNEEQLRKNISHVIHNKEEVVKKYKNLIEKKYFNREESVNKIIEFIGNNCD